MHHCGYYCSYPRISQFEVELLQLVVESDADENRAIDFPEFLKLVPKIMIEMETRSRGTYKDYSEESFANIDEDGDGLVSGTELRDSAPSINRPFSSEHFHKIIQKTDIDGDGLASYVELLIRVYITQNFSGNNRKYSKKLVVYDHSFFGRFFLIHTLFFE